MFREMRRKRQQMPESEAIAILERGSHGVLAVLGDGGYPYAVPISYVYEAGKIYMHCAKSGHKLDAVRACEKASFCVVDRDEVVQAEFTTHYRSVIAFGRVHEITGEAGKRRAAALLAGEMERQTFSALGLQIHRQYQPADELLEPCPARAFRVI